MSIDIGVDIGIDTSMSMSMSKGESYNMSMIQRLFVFMVIKDGEEQVVAWPDEHGNTVPLVYISYKAMLDDNMKEIIQEMAEKYKLYFELREYQLVSFSEERFYPSHKQYNA